MNEVHKNFNLTQWGSHTLRWILLPHMMVTENLQKLHKICFGTFPMIFIFHCKIDLIECEPHFVKLNFLWTSSIVKVFDFLTFDILWYLKYNLQFLDIFDIFWTSWHLLTSWYLTFHLKHLSPSQGYFFFPQFILFWHFYFDYPGLTFCFWSWFFFFPSSFCFETFILIPLVWPSVLKVAFCMESGLTFCFESGLLCVKVAFVMAFCFESGFLCVKVAFVMAFCFESGLLLWKWPVCESGLLCVKVAFCNGLLLWKWPSVMKVAFCNGLLCEVTFYNGLFVYIFFQSFENFIFEINFSPQSIFLSFFGKNVFFLNQE